MLIHARKRSHAILGFAVSIPVAITSAILAVPAAAQPVDHASNASLTVSEQINSLQLSSAVNEYTSGNADSVAHLVEVVSPQNGIDRSLAEEDNPWIAVEENLFSEGLSISPDLGVSFAEPISDAKVIDGIVVSSDASQDLDLAHRETEHGKQFVTVLGSKESPSDLAYELDLPDKAQLKQLHDGSIDIIAPIDTEVSLPGEDERIEEAATAIIGNEIHSLDELDSLTDEQLEQLAAVPDAETETVTENQRIGTIDAPWAVDANGQPVETAYSIEGHTLVQTVEIQADTAFPVIADPSFSWWAEKGTKCALGVGTLAFFGYGKIAVALGKLVVKMRNASAASKLGKAYAAWKKLGTSNSSRFGELVKQVKSLASLVIQKGGKSAFAKHKAKSKKAAASIAFLKEGGQVIGSIFGIGACIDMVKAK